MEGKPSMSNAILCYVVAGRAKGARQGLNQEPLAP